MAKQYIVQITDEALQDMENLYNHIALKLLAPENAIGKYNRIAEDILKLNSFPERFKIIDIDLESARELRRMSIDNYSVFYVIKDNCVIVTDVLYSAPDISRRLK